MFRRISTFRIGLVLVTIGIIWTGIVFAQAVKESKSFSIDKLESANISLDHNGSGIGFYHISSNQYNIVLLAKITDSNGNYLDAKTITNKETVNYFHFDKTDKYTLELTNLSDKSIKVTIELGDTRHQDFEIPSFMIFFGSAALVLSGYKKLHSHITAQPEENI